MISLADLLKIKTADQLYNEALAYLATQGLPLANWRTGGPYRTLLRIHSRLVEMVYAVQVAFVQGGYVATAQGDWLTLLAESLFGEARMQAVFAEGMVTLTAAPGAGPYTLGPGSAIVSTASGLRYRAKNPLPVTIPLGGVATIPVKAESPGAKYNVGANAILRLDAPALLGVTVGNSATWQTTAGADEETDDRLRLRCLSKWGTLSTGSPASAYIYWALTASPEVVKVGVHSNLREGAFSPNWITLVLGGDGVQISDAALTAVNNYIDPRVPVGDSVAYKKAVAAPIILTGTVYATAADLDRVRGEAQVSLDALARMLPLGNTQMGGTTVYRTRIIDAIHYEGNKGKVRNVDLVTPALDTTLTYLQYATFVNNLSFQGV